MKKFLKKCLAMFLAITMPIWVIPFMLIFLICAGIYDAYKKMSEIVGVEK